MKKRFVIFVEIAFWTSRERFEEILSRTCLFFNLIWILWQNFPKFGEIFQQNRQKCILRLQRNILTKTLLASWNKFHLWAKSFRICAGKVAGLLSYEHYLFPDGQLEESFCKKFYFFLYFFGPPGDFFLVFLLNHFMNGSQNCIFHAKKNRCIKKNILTKLVLSNSDYKGYFLKLSLKYLMHDCQNYILRVQRSTLRRVPDCEGKFLHFHWNMLGMVVKTTVYVFRGAHWEKLSSLRLFQNCFRTLSDNRPHLLWKFSTALPKLHSACPKNFWICFAVVCQC